VVALVRQGLNREAVLPVMRLCVLLDRGELAGRAEFHGPMVVRCDELEEHRTAP
jgi:hypothetical protein